MAQLPPDLSTNPEIIKQIADAIAMQRDNHILELFRNRGPLPATFRMPLRTAQIALGVRPGPRLVYSAPGPMARTGRKRPTLYVVAKREG